MHGMYSGYFRMRCTKYGSHSTRKSTARLYRRKYRAFDIFHVIIRRPQHVVVLWHRSFSPCSQKGLTLRFSSCIRAFGLLRCTMVFLGPGLCSYTLLKATICHRGYSFRIKITTHFYSLVPLPCAPPLSKRNLVFWARGFTQRSWAFSDIKSVAIECKYAPSNGECSIQVSLEATWLESFCLYHLWCPKSLQLDLSVCSRI